MVIAPVKSKLAIALLSVITILVFTGCGGSGGGSAVAPTDSVSSGLAGRAFKGPIQNGTVNVYVFQNDGTRGSLLGSGTTDGNGDFDIDVADYEGPVWIEVPSGTYLDEGTGFEVELTEDAPLVALVSDFDSSIPLANLAITPITTIAASLAIEMVEDGEEPEVACETALELVESYFGLEDILFTLPVDLSDEEEDGAREDEIDYALVIAGLANVADDYDVASMELIQALGEDVKDGIFDGEGENGWWPFDFDIDADAVSIDLAAAMEDFINRDVIVIDIDPDDWIDDIDDIEDNDGALDWPFIANIDPGCGIAGDEVTIYGMNFDDEISVYFDNIEAANVVVSDWELAIGQCYKSHADDPDVPWPDIPEGLFKKITCTIPVIGPGFADVKVVNPDEKQFVDYEGFYCGEVAVPALVSPADGTVDFSLSGTLDWDPVEEIEDLPWGEVYYEIVVATDEEFAPESIIILYWTPEDEFDLETVVVFGPDIFAFVPGGADTLLDYGTTYYWRVRARYVNPVSDWSEARSFTTEEVPAQ